MLNGILKEDVLLEDISQGIYAIVCKEKRVDHTNNNYYTVNHPVEERSHLALLQELHLAARDEHYRECLPSPSLRETS